MFVERFHLEALGHASTLVGSQKSGEALLLDPRRDVDQYLETATERGVRITHVIDSHGHNDYVSGLAEVADRTGAEVLASAHGEAEYDHRPVKDGETLEMEDVSFEVVHTPGHTPEHISLLVRDLSAGDEPVILLSGGSLLVGDVARPDLLGGREEAREAAKTLCRTLEERILALPDHVEVLPTHVAGSLCASGIGTRLSTTIGYERETNQALIRAARGEGCVDLDVLPAVPPYWRRMRPINMVGAPVLGAVDPPPPLTPDAFEERAREASVLDTRSPEAFAAGHVPGALNAGLAGSFPTWAGTVLPEGAEVLLVLEGPGDLMEATWHLLRIGYDPPVGWLDGGMEAWRTSGKEMASVPALSVHEFREKLGRDEVDVLDVRQPAEWAAGHIEGATWITGAELPERLDEVAEGRPLAVLCGSGYRSSVAGSLIAARTEREVLNVLGGMTAWSKAGYPVEKG